MTSKTWIRIWIVIIITCVIWFSSLTFAADWDWENFSVLFSYILSVLSWIWILLANIAGTFLTNKWVYWEALQLDVLLRKFRNIIKNIANFWLWFYFIYVIFKWLIKQWKDSITKNIKDVILRLLIAGVWIQASRFLTATVVDISTITLSAAGALPSEIIAGTPSIQESVKRDLKDYFPSSWEEITQWKVITLFPPNAATSEYISTIPVKLKEPQTMEEMIDDIMPKDESVSGPLHYMWFSILKANKVATLSLVDKNKIKASIFNMIIQSWTSIIYSVEMFVLCAVALMRMLYLWMFIVLSPLAVLIWCIEQSWQKLSWSGDKSFLSKFTKQINIKSFLINVFKPTIIVLWIWLVTIFVTNMNSVIQESTGREISFGTNWATFRSGTGKVEGDDVYYNSEIDTSMISITLSNAWKTLLEFVLSVITVILVYAIIKLAVKMWWWTDFVSEKIGKVQDSVENTLWSLPVIPVSTYDSEGKPTTRFISAGRTFGFGRSRGNNLLTERVRTYENDINEVNNKQNEIIRSFFGNKVWYLTSQEENQIKSKIGTNWDQTTIDDLNMTKEYINSIKTEEWKWMTLNPVTASNNNFWRKQFEAWLTKATDLNDSPYPWRTMQEEWKKQGEKDLKKLFEKERFRNAYANFFGLSDITTLDELMNADISKK